MEVGQKADLGQDFVIQQVGFIDEKDRVQVAGGVHRQDVLLDVSEHGCPTAG